jgi:hypothetical protein
MKKFQWPLRAFLFVGLLQIVSCTKSVDTSNNDSVSVERSDDLSLTTTNEFSNCKLRRIYHDLVVYDFISSATMKVYGLFSYNAAGNPYTLLYRDLQGAQNVAFPSYHFFYDNQQRLREMRLSYYEGTRVAEIHRYGYNSSNAIVVDTTIIPDDAGNDDITVSTLTYDSLGRVVKENIRNIQTSYGPLRSTRNPTYTYDSRGNIAVSGWRSSWYDTKVSFLRTHPLFMFLTRNYSRNNPWNLNSQGQKYNSRGLPLSIKIGNDVFFQTVNIEKIVYDCQ